MLELKKFLVGKSYASLFLLFAIVAPGKVCADNFEQIARAKHIIIMHIESAEAFPKKGPDDDGIGAPGPMGNYFVVAKGVIQRNIFGEEGVTKESKSIPICISGGVNVGSNYLIFTDGDLRDEKCSSVVAFLIQSSSGKPSDEKVFIDYSVLGFLPEKIKVHQSALKYSGFDVDEKYCNPKRSGVIFIQAYIKMADLIDVISHFRLVSSPPG